MFSLLPSVMLKATSVHEEAESVALTNLRSFSLRHKHLIVEISANNSSSTHSFAEITFNNKRGIFTYYTSCIFSDNNSVRNSCSDKKKDTAYIRGLDIPPASEGYGCGYVILPYCYQDDRAKTTMGFFCHEGKKIVRTTGQYNSHEPLDTITIRLSKGTFAVGSNVRLYGVEQGMLVEEIFLKSRGKLLFENLSQTRGSLFLVGSVRSSSSRFHYAVQHKGDRLYQIINDNDKSSYFYQRLTGEGHNRRSIVSSMKWVVLKKIIRRLQMCLVRLRVISATQLLCVQDQGGEERRVAWVPNAEADNGLFGAHVAVYPDPLEGSNCHPWLSFHGAYEGVWNPVATESGVWLSCEALTKLYLYPRGGPESKGRDAESGSVESLYEISPNRVVFKVTEEVSRIKIQCPSGGYNLHILIHARSEDACVEDVVGVLFNQDRDHRDYQFQTMEAKNENHMGGNCVGFGVATLPAADAADGESGIVMISIPEYNAQDRSKQILCSYGGKTIVGLCGGVWSKHEAIRMLEFSLRSGASFALGSKVETWVN